jgi:hypothetical protein
VKKKRSAETVLLMVGLPTSFSVRCSWKRRRSSLLAVWGERPRKVPDS